MKAADVVVTPDWLSLREPADAAARSTTLVGRLAAALESVAGPHQVTQVVHDLGCGSGSMGRWLAPRLPGPQHWVLHDRDPVLLAVAASAPPPRTSDGTDVTVEVRRGDLTRLRPGDLAGASLVTASALLDLLTTEELARVVRSCAGAVCPVLISLSVTGQVRVVPPDPLDADLERAFNEHQRRTVSGRTLLGPDAADVAAGTFRDLGWRVEVEPSPWQLGPSDSALTAEWLDGWVGAAVEQRPGLAPDAGAWLARRAGEATRLLAVTVQHVDLLALPPGVGG